MVDGEIYRCNEHLHVKVIPWWLIKKDFQEIIRVQRVWGYTCNFKGWMCNVLVTKDHPHPLMTTKDQQAISQRVDV